MRCVSRLAQRRYVLRMMGAALFCIVFSFMAAFGLRHGLVSGWPAFFLAKLPSTSIMTTLVVIGACLSEQKDEFRRNLYIQAILCGVAATLAVVTAWWGYLEDFGRAPYLRLVWVYPMLWIFVVAAFPLVGRRYRA